MAIEALIRNNVVLDNTVRSIPLDKGLFSIIDESDYEKISKYKYRAARSKGRWYALRDEGKKTIYMHQDILGKKEGFEPDHKNGNGLDNRRSNLRFVTHQQNLQNQKKRGIACSSKYKGVTRHIGGKYQARIKAGGKQLHLGLFIDEVDAARAYDKAAIEHFGEFANVNFPEEIGSDKN
jgi:hypothetical protein